ALPSASSSVSGSDSSAASVSCGARAGFSRSRSAASRRSLAHEVAGLGAAFRFELGLRIGFLGGLRLLRGQGGLLQEPLG
ncbi:hypothetical protein CTI14_68545, partial [Methylobacterium radiotolerans]